MKYRSNINKALVNVWDRAWAILAILGNKISVGAFKLNKGIQQILNIKYIH